MFPSAGGAHPSPEALFAGRYAVDGALPWSGVASYYRASSEGTPLILCVLPLNLKRSRQAEAAFARLAHGLGAIRSPVVPRILDAGIIDGVPYLAFQDLRGMLLADVIRDRPLSSLDVIRIGADILDALGAAHAQGVVHGDLTPQNVIITRTRDGQLRARLIGIGVVPLIRSAPDASPFAAHTGSGKHAVAYMAPEIFHRGTFEGAADQYAVGALLHHLGIGAPPIGWDGGEGFDDLRGLPDVIGRAMSKQPSSRYPDAASMRAALEWIEAESAKHNPQTQDIAPWMETSYIGSIPVPALASSVPPAQVISSMPVGKVVSISSGRPVPIEPIVIEALDPEINRRWRQIALLLFLLGSLVLSGYWWKAKLSANPATTRPDFDPGAQHVE